MEYSEYKQLYDSLITPEDVRRLEKEGHDPRLLDTLYTQKVSRMVKKRYHQIKKDAKFMLKDWKKGSSFLSISKEKKFPPILIMMITLQEDGVPKKKFWDIIKDPSILKDENKAEDIRRAVDYDLVYSPAANDRQKERGLWGENLLHNWLDKQGVTYKTENEIRDEEGCTKTPDCLFHEPMMFEGKKIYWIESKASFGDSVEFRFNSNKQLIPYTELFGPGVVVYWTGFVEGMQCPPDVRIEDIGILNKKLERIEQE